MKKNLLILMCGLALSSIVNAQAPDKALTGGNASIQNNGRIIPCSNKNFSVPLGVKMQINYGRIR